MKRNLYFLLFFVTTTIQAQLALIDSARIQKNEHLHYDNDVIENVSIANLDSISNIPALKGFKEALQKDSVVNILALGDSRVEQPTIVEPLIEKLIATFGYAGIGYLSSGGYNSRGVFSNTGTQKDIDQIGFAKWSIHGRAYALDADTEQYNVVKTSSDITGYVKTIKFYYLALKGGGKFRIVINNAIIDTIDTNSSDTNAMVKTFLWVSDSLLKGDVSIKTQAIFSESYLLGMDIRNGKKGIVFHKCGNGSASTKEFWDWHSKNSVGNFFASEIKPSLIISLMGANNNNVNNEPFYRASYLLNVFEVYKRANKSLSIIILGETGSQLSDEEEDNLNVAYYMAASNYPKNIMFVNLKDVVKDWSNFSLIPGMTWVIGDNIHWGVLGGDLAANYIWAKIKTGELAQKSIFPRFYKKNQNNSQTFCDVSKNANTNEEAVNLSFVDLNFIPTKIDVKINGVSYFHKDSGKKPFWISYKTIIEAFDENDKQVIIDTIEVRIKE